MNYIITNTNTNYIIYDIVYYRYCTVFFVILNYTIFYMFYHKLYYIYVLYYRRCQNYKTKLGVQKYGKIPYLCTPPDPDSARIRILFYN